MTSDRRTHLVLYLDQGTSLHTFKRTGTLDRELAVYKRLSARGMPVTIFSWGRGGDATLQEEIRPLCVEENRTGGRNRLWMIRQLCRWTPPVGHSTVVMTNQMLGAELAVLGCIFARHPLVLRCGYLRSENIESSRGHWSFPALVERGRELFVLPFCDAIIVTSERMKRRWCSRYPWIEKRMHILPNYVDEEVFKPSSQRRDYTDQRRLDLFFTGRLAQEKNLDLLIEAVRRSSNVSLKIVGEGPEKMRLQRLADSCGGRVSFLGIVDNKRLPALYARADGFVLPSRYEGNPKALLEAMACGLPVVGTKVRGIEDVIDDEICGLITDQTVDSLVQAFRRLMDPALRETLGRNARRKILQENSLLHYTTTLHALLEDVLANSRRSTR